MKTEIISRDRLKKYENNARTHSKSQIEKIAKSIKEFGFVNPVLIDENLNVLAGHGRIAGAELLGLEEIPCVYVDGLSEEQKRAYIIADNKIAEDSGWDLGILKTELQDLQTEGIDLTLTGFDIDEMSFIEEIPDDINDESIEETTKTSEKASQSLKVQRGDIYKLGEHRLMCGDATNAIEVEKLIGDEIIDLYLTDPPYGVNYGASGSQDERSDGKIVENDDLSAEDLSQMLYETFNNVNMHLKEGGAFYIFFASSQTMAFHNAVANVEEWDKHSELVWVKNALVLSRTDYQQKHEPIIYGWKKGAPHYFINMRTLTTTLGEINFERISREEAVKLLREVQEAMTTQYEKRPQKSPEHPTMKPLPLIERLVRNSSRKGERVYDSFGGSGTTLLACEEMGRKCYTMELSEEYCETIINRWEKMTGQEAQKINE